MKTTSIAPVSGASVWTAEDFEGRDDWIVVLDREHVVELEGALANVRARELALSEVTQDTFPLPTMRGVIDGVLEELERGRGFVLLRGLPVDRYTEEDASIIYCGIGLHMGKTIPQNKAGDLLGHVRDQGYDFRETNVRGYTTRAYLPFHTDGSDVVGLLCMKTARSGGQSSLASSMTVHNLMLAEAPDLLAELYRPWHFDRRAEVGVGDQPTFVSAIFSEFEGKVSCRYVPGILRSAPEKLGTQLTDVERGALDLFDDITVRRPVPFSMDLEPGDIQFVSNHTVLHSRTEYEDHPEPERKRHLLRLWLALHNGRELDPSFRSGRPRAGHARS